MWLHNWAEADLEIEICFLYMDCHAGGGSGLYLTMETGRGHAGVAVREDAGIERTDEAVEAVAADVATAGDGRADPRIPSSSGCVSLAIAVSGESQIACFFGPVTRYPCDHQLNEKDAKDVAP